MVKVEVMYMLILVMVKVDVMYMIMVMVIKYKFKYMVKLKGLFKQLVVIKIVLEELLEFDK